MKNRGEKETIWLEPFLWYYTTSKELLHRHDLKKEQKNSDSAIPPSVGSIVEGRVVARDRSSLFIDLGNQGTGIIYGREFYEVKEVIKALNIGDTVFAKIVEWRKKNI